MGITRLAAWVCFGFVAVLSLLPSAEMVRTSFGGHVEHAMAYAVLAALMRLGYPAWGAGRLVLALVAYAGLLECMQNFSPGRGPAVADWLASSAGVLIGVGVACWAAGWISAVGHRMGRRSVIYRDRRTSDG